MFTSGWVEIRTSDLNLYNNSVKFDLRLRSSPNSSNFLQLENSSRVQPDFCLGSNFFGSTSKVWTEHYFKYLYTKPFFVGTTTTLPSSNSTVTLTWPSEPRNLRSLSASLTSPTSPHMREQFRFWLGGDWLSRLLTPRRVFSPNSTSRSSHSQSVGSGQSTSLRIVCSVLGKSSRVVVIYDRLPHAGKHAIRANIIKAK
jgi:hypothetical protein